MYLRLIYIIVLIADTVWAVASGSRFWAPVMVFFVDTWVIKFCYDDFKFYKNLRRKYVKKRNSKK